MAFDFTQSRAAESKQLEHLSSGSRGQPGVQNVTWNGTPPVAAPTPFGGDVGARAETGLYERFFDPNEYAQGGFIFLCDDKTYADQFSLACTEQVY